MALNIFPQAIGAIQRIGVSDSLVIPETVPRFIADLTAFAQSDMNRAQELQNANMAEVAASYGCGYSSPEREKPFVFYEGVAVIPVRGILLNRFNWSWSYATGYNFIRAQLNAVLDDLAVDGGDVELLAFDVDTPGGEAVGCFELCADIMRARERVQMISVVDALAASAGYAIASAPQRMVCTPSGSVGSIGVYRLHMNIQKALEQMGVEITIFQAGAHKTDGHPYGPPSADAAEEFQKGVEKRWDEFIAVVAEQRDMDPSLVRDTQAQIYRADKALDLRLIDAVNTPSEAVSQFMAELAGDDPQGNGDDDMALPKNETELAAQIAAAEERGKASVQVPDVSAASQAAVTADRERRSQIMALPEAEKRQKLAGTLANGDYSVDQAKVLLTAAAEEAPPAAVAAVTTTAAEDAISTDPKANPGETISEFSKRMNAGGSPNLSGNDLGGDDLGGAGGGTDDSKAAAAILSTQAKFGGVKHRSFGQQQQHQTQQ